MDDKKRYGNTYTQNITQHGGLMNASQTGNVSAQQLTIGDFDGLQSALADLRRFFRRQDDSADVDEIVGQLASAEKAASRRDEPKLFESLKRIPARAWEIGRAVLPEVLLHYLRTRGLA